MTTLLSYVRSHSERSEVRFSIARPSSDESLFGVQNRPASAIVSSLSFLFVVILNAVKDLLLLFSFRCFPSSSTRPNHPVVDLGALSPFVVIPTERSDEGSLFASRTFLRATL